MPSATSSLLKNFICGFISLTLTSQQPQKSMLCKTIVCINTQHFKVLYLNDVFSTYHLTADQAVFAAIKIKAIVELSSNHFNKLIINLSY